MECELYLDESGNTHNDWFNKDQPYFVYGGWLIEKSKRACIEEYVNKLPIKKAKELKAKNTFKNNIDDNDKKYKEFINIFNDFMCKYNAIPFFHISNKKFMISALIVDVLFDPKYNKSMNNHIIKSDKYETSTLKIALASYILLNDNNKCIIESFSELIRNNNIDINKLILIKNNLIELFNLKLPKVSNSLKFLEEENLLDIIKEFNQYNETKFINSIVTPAISNLFMNLIECLSNNNCSHTLSIYYDNLSNYDKTLEKIKKEILDTYPATTENIDKNKKLIYGSNNIKINEMNSVDSKNNTMIQMADLLCGFTIKTYINILKNKNINIHIKSFWQLFLANLLSKNKQFMSINEDNSTKYKLYKILFSSETNLKYIINKLLLIINKKNYKSETIIKKYFEDFLN